MKAGRVLISCLMALAFALSVSFANAQDDAREQALTAGAKIDQKAVEAAVKKACDWLRNKQNSDGSWKSGSKECRASSLPNGTTALVLLALLKGGEDPDAKCIKDGFNYVFKSLSSKEQYVYDVAVLILALAARYHPPDELEEEEIEKELEKGKIGKTTLFDPPEKRQKKKFKKAPPAVKKWFTDLIKWLISKQRKDGGWAYGVTMDQVTDLSNTQYVVLAFHAATRCGVNVSSGVFAKLAELVLIRQEKKGPEIEWFPVPVADFDIKKLKEMEKEYLKSLRRNVAQAHERAQARGEKLAPKEVKKMTTTTVVIEDPYKKFGVEPQKIRARGWGYWPHDFWSEMGKDSIVHRATGSMTCSGVAVLAVAKANIEGGSWWSKHKKKLNRGLRDGCGWLAHNFTIKENPKMPEEWHYYYLYGLERAGILSLVRDFGKHNWYAKGGNYLLDNQKGNGSWPGKSGLDKHPVPGKQGAYINPANIDPLVNTCFAVLFLKQATAPVVKIPREDPSTGEDLFGPKKKQEKNK